MDMTPAEHWHAWLERYGAAYATDEERAAAYRDFLGEPGRIDRRVLGQGRYTMMLRTAAVLAAATTAVGIAVVLANAPTAHADVDGVHCAYSIWAGHWVATEAQPGGGPPVFIGYCDGGLRSGGPINGLNPNYGRQPGQ